MKLPHLAGAGELQQAVGAASSSSAPLHGAGTSEAASFTERRGQQVGGDEVADTEEDIGQEDLSLILRSRGPGTEHENPLNPENTTKVGKQSPHLILGPSPPPKKNKYGHMWANFVFLGILGAQIRDGDFICLFFCSRDAGVFVLCTRPAGSQVLASECLSRRMRKQSISICPQCPVVVPSLLLLSVSVYGYLPFSEHQVAPGSRE